MVTQFNIFAPHLLNAFLRAIQSRNRGLLYDRSGIGSGLALQLGHGAHNRGGGEGVAQTPAGHGIGLRQRTQDDDALFVFAQRSHGKVLAGVVQVNVALVGQNPDAALLRQADEFGHILRAHHRARWIRWRVENDGLGPRSDQVRNHVGGNPKASSFVGLQQHALAARVTNNVFERNPVGNR